MKKDKEWMKKDKPIIPKFVAEAIKKDKERGYDVYDSIDLIIETNGGGLPSLSDWVARNIDRYARAWLDDYTVEVELNQLDEPQKPVIPQFVADYIEKWKHENLTMYEWLSFGNNDVDEDVYKWLYNNLNEKNRRREYLLIDAIRNGYEVEKEKLYRVRAGNRYVRFNLDGSIIGVKKDNSIVCLERLAKLPFDYKKAVESGIITLEEVTE